MKMTMFTPISGRNALFVTQNEAVHDRNAGYIQQTQPKTLTN